MNRAEALWPLGRYTFGWLGALTARVRYYGSERIPTSGGRALRSQQKLYEITGAEGPGASWGSPASDTKVQ